MRTFVFGMCLSLFMTINLKAQFATPLPGHRPAKVVVYDHFRSDYARYRDSVDKAFSESVVKALCREGDQCEKAKFRGGQWWFPKVDTAKANKADTAKAKADSAKAINMARFTQSLKNYPPPKYLEADKFCSTEPEQERARGLQELAGQDSAAQAVLEGVCQQALIKDGVTYGVYAKKKSWKPQNEAVTWLPLRPPGWHRRGDIVRYLGGENQGLFTQFAAGLSDKEAYAVTDVISGLMGRTLFAANFAAVVVTDTTEDQVTRQFVENNKANVLRMINNGGTLTGRVLVPLFAHSGPTFQTAASVYGTAGLIGPIGSPDSLKFASSAVAEIMTGHSIRDILESATDLGELLVGGRFGWAFSESEFLGGTGDHWFPYAQVGIGIRKNGVLALSALLTWAIEDKYKEFAPRKLLLNFSAKP